MEERHPKGVHRAQKSKRTLKTGEKKGPVASCLRGKPTWGRKFTLIKNGSKRVFKNKNKTYRPVQRQVWGARLLNWPGKELGTRTHVGKGRSLMEGRSFQETYWRKLRDPRVGRE